jgi:hypothetical protein
MDHSAHGGGASLPAKPKVPPEMAAFLAARLGEQDLPELDSALDSDRRGQASADAASFVLQAAQSYGNQRQMPREQFKVPSALRDFVTRKQAEAATMPPVPKPEDDPTSPESQAARAALLQTPHGRAVRDSLGESFEQLSAGKLKPLLPMWRASADTKPPSVAKPADAPPDEVDEAELRKRGIALGLAKTHSEALDLIGRHDSAQAQRDARGAATQERHSADDERRGREKTGAGIDLRKEFQALPVVKDMQHVAGNYEKIRTTSPTGPGDISMIFAFMKMIDPTSTVREGEFATAENAGGVPSKVWGFYNKAMEGQKLPDGVRQQFRAEAKSLYDAQRKRYDAHASQYRRLATQAGLAPGDVVLDLLDGGEGSGPGAVAAPAGGPARISSDAEYEALPVGAKYVAPDGSTRTKRGR